MRHRRFTFLLASAAALLVAANAAFAQYQINWYSINSGGGTVSGGSYTLNASIGQSTAGFVSNSSFLHWIGFWSGDIPSPTVAQTAGAAKKLADGTFVSVAGKIASSSATDFTAYFYLQEPDRSSGLRVATPASAVAGLARGSVVNVIGTMATTASGEREIVGPLVIIASSTTPPAPLTMANKSIGGGNLGTPPLGQYGVTGGYGVNNVGLLVRTFGQVVSADATTVTIDDGSGTPVRVNTSTLASQPAVGTYIIVVGVSSLDQPVSNRLRLVLPRGNSDVATP